MKTLFNFLFAGVLISCNACGNSANSGLSDAGTSEKSNASIDSTEYLLAYTDSVKDGLPLIGFKKPSGEVVIKAQYSSTYGDTLRQSIFVNGSDGWVMINKKGEKILKPFIFDNGPDYVVEGFFRFVDDKGKMGFADVNGKIVIPAQFDFVSQFDEDGTANYYMGGSLEKNAEYARWVGATEEGKIDKTGKKLKGK